jgi:hypothetical protein
MSESPPYVRPCELCPSPADWIPVLLLYPSILHGPSKALTVQVWKPLCTAHRKRATKRDLIRELATEHVYNCAEEACANDSKPWPERSRTRLDFITYAESGLAKKKDAERAKAN